MGNKSGKFQDKEDIMRKVQKAPYFKIKYHTTVDVYHYGKFMISFAQTPKCNWTRG